MALLLVVPVHAATAPQAATRSSAGALAATGSVRGRVRAPDGDGLPAILVVATREGPGTDRVVEVVADDEGAFALDALAPGRWTLTARSDDGLAEAHATVALGAGEAAQVTLRLQVVLSEDVTVTDTRGARLKRETPATVGTVKGDVLRELRPSHPSEVMGQIPGVWVNVTGGEGHQTAIRQPLTTNPVYLFLEDGVPTRSTGFFNHNALYEINVPAADGIEVTKGPGSALYGSDAIGGVVNVVTRSSLGHSGLDATMEGGAFGWRRLLAGANWSKGSSGVRGTLNVTSSNGWRDATGYERMSGTLRWDLAGHSSLSKLLVSVNDIDQQTAGSSTLSEIDYLREPTANLTPISLRAVQAYRVSLDYQRIGKGAAWSVVPYARYDSMDLLANWSLTYDPTRSVTDNYSVGVLAKVQRELEPMRTTLLAGVDVDVSPGGRVEDVVLTQVTPSDLPSGRGIFSAYTTGARVYDYGVTFAAASPYAQVEFSPAARLRISAGLRADRMRYDYDDRSVAPETPRHRRPESGVRTFTHLSPKLGVTWQVSEHANVFASYRHAFRAPSEGQLFRQGSTASTFDLEPVRADNVEAGARIRLRRGISTDVSIYQLDKRDDILSWRDPVDGTTHAVNAGHTRHRGIEFGLDAQMGARAGARVAYTRARHTYERWQPDPAAGLDYDGRTQEMAPRDVGSVSAYVVPTHRLRLGGEFAYVGAYWLDAANTTAYGGHGIVNLRAQYDMGRGVRAFARVMNLGDRLYAESGSYALQRGREFAPGRPRSVFAGVEVEWRRP